jgi:Na+-transporting methylmalonyl-CoA/oxaloacetate decarboxylase beta subunit
MAVVNVPQRAQSEAAAIAIIGGADGPTAMAVGRAPGQSPMHAAVSALTFEAQDVIAWQPVFCVKTCEDVTVQIV